MRNGKLAMLCAVLALALLTQGCGDDKDSCSDGTFGNPNEKPSISIISSGSESISGVANNINAGKVRVVGWALTDRYYVQPLQDDPITCIKDRGSWKFATHPWRQIVVLLVDETYNVPAGPIDYHPAQDPGVIAYTEE